MALIWLEIEEKRFEAFFFRSVDEYVKDISHPWSPNMPDLMTLPSVQLQLLMKDSETRVPSNSNKTRIASAIIEDWGNICARRQEKFVRLTETRQTNSGGYAGDLDAGDRDGGDRDGGDRDDEDEGQDVGGGGFYPPLLEDGKITVNGILPNRRLITVKAKPTDTIAVIKVLFQVKCNIARSDQRLFLDGYELEEDARLGEIVEDDEMTVDIRTTISGGGKRGAGQVASSTNPASGAKSKQEAMDMIEEKVGMCVLRFNSVAGASPSITTCSNRITQLMNMAKQENFDMKAMLMTLSETNINKMMNVTTASTRPEARCKIISDIIFADLTTQLNELKRQYELAMVVLPTATQFMMTSKFSDETGGIAWTEFMKLLGTIVKEQTIEQNVPSVNGLGG